MPGDFAFDLKALRARDEINDALGVMQNQRMGMPGMNYQPQQGPTPSMSVQATPQMQQMGANMPLGGGFSAEMNAMRVPGMGQGPQITNVGVNYQKPGGLSAGLSYNPAARGVNANVRVPFRNGGLAMGGSYMGQPFNPELSQKLLGRAAQVEALNRRYKSRYGLQDSDIDAMFQGTYGLNMADPADSPEFEAARLVSSPYRNELANIYGDLPTMRYALSSPVNALGRTRDSLNQLDVARDRAQQSLVDSSAPEWEQQYLAYMTGATEQMPPAPIGNTPEEWTRRMEIVRTYGPDTAQATVKNWGDTRSAYPDRVAAERAEANEVREGSMGAYNTALADINRGAGMARGGLAAKKMAKGGAWTRKEGQNPEGGLNAAGRASLKAQGHDIKPPVSAKQAKKSPKAAARRKSFCARMSGMPGAMKDENGKPTRKALALRKWDCKAEGGMVEGYAEGGQSRVNEAGNYTKPGMRKRLFESIKSGGSGGAPGQWSARKAQMLAKRYKEQGGGYK